MTVLRMTAAEVEAHQQRVKAPASPAKARVEYVPYKERKRGMNGLEAAYAAHLTLLKHAGDVDWFEFEPMRLKLADGTWYKPDFAVVRGGQLEFCETKGFMREAARVRLNVAAGKFPFPFYLVRKKPHGQFEVRRIGQS